MLKLILALCVVCFAFDGAWAQRADDPARVAAAARPRIQLPIDPLGFNNKLGSDAGDNDLLGALEAQLLPDLKFALNIARANGNDLTGDCWASWINMIEARQKANLDANGNPLDIPDPALITRFQKLVDIRNALQPTSPFMRACSPVITMVKSDVRKFIGLILTGGFGLAAMGVGL